MNDKSWYITLGRLAATGFEIVASVLVSLFIGNKLDEYFNTTPVFILIFSIVGLGAMFKIVLYNFNKNK